jgi:hypothetical protein
MQKSMPVVVTADSLSRILLLILQRHFSERYLVEGGKATVFQAFRF